MTKPKACVGCGVARGDRMRGYCGRCRTALTEHRFWERCYPQPSGCLEWRGARISAGYGTLTVEGKTVLAHRFAWELLEGPIPEGMTLDHLCRNRGCVNVMDLEVVTMHENWARGISPTAENARRKRQASRGALAADDPRHGTVNGYRNFLCRCDACRAADSAQKRAYKARRRASG